MQDREKIRDFTQYIRQTRNNTIELIHQNQGVILFALGLQEKDVLVTPENGQKKIVILSFYEKEIPKVWVTRFNKGGFAYGGFNTDEPVPIAELSKLFAWVNYNKTGLSENIAKEFELYGNP